MHGSGPGRHLGLGLLGALALWIPGTVIAAGEKGSNAFKVVGLATQVEPGQVTILAADGKEVTVTTQEDFTQKVAVGSKVTAWYFARDSGYALERLEYPLENFFVPASEIRSAVKKVIILANSSVVEADGVYDEIARFLHSSLGWYVAPRMLAEEIRSRHGTRKGSSTLDALDPATGHFDMARYLRGQDELVRLLASETRVDTVLEIDVEQVQAQVRRLVAAWDGVEEPIAGKGMRTLARFTIFPEKGEAAAATVVLKLWDAHGKLLWSQRRGIALLAVLEGSGNRLRNRPLPEFLRDTANVQKWLHTVFSSMAGSASDRTTTAKRVGEIH